MFTDQDVQLHRDHYRQIGCEMIAKGDTVPATAFIFCTRDPRTGDPATSPVVITLVYNEALGRERFIHWSQAMAIAGHASHAITLSDAWFATTKPGVTPEQAMTMRASQMPDRQECLVLNEERADGVIRNERVPYIRDDGRVIFSESIVMTSTADKQLGALVVLSNGTPDPVHEDAARQLAKFILEAHDVTEDVERVIERGRRS